MKRSRLTAHSKNLGLYRLLKKLAIAGVLKGHEFIRAVKSLRMNAALAARDGVELSNVAEPCLSATCFSPCYLSCSNPAHLEVFSQP
jgi:hypothetical protein